MAQPILTKKHTHKLKGNKKFLSERFSSVSF